MPAMVARAGIEIDGRSVVLAVTELAHRGDFRLVVAGSPGETLTEVPTMTQATLGSFVAPAPALPVTISGSPQPNTGPRPLTEQVLGAHGLA